MSLVEIEVRKEINGLEMGVFSNGTTFVSMRALSRLCGVANSSLSETAAQWLAGRRDSKLAQWLVRSGFNRDSLYSKTAIPGVAGNSIYAFMEDISTLVLEYYAFEAPTPTAEAVRNCRILLRAGIRIFIYNQVGYDPQNLVPTQWREFHDRLAMHALPSGYFSVFRELADFLLASIRAGLRVDHRTIPDISVGMTWSTFWTSNKLADKYGERSKCDHNYPEYFPQAKSNPQDMWIYPADALGEFRRWLDSHYIPSKFPAYLQGKVAQGLLPPSAAELLLTEVAPIVIGAGTGT